MIAKLPTTMKNKFLIAMPCFPNWKGFNHRTILVSAKDKNDAIAQARHHHPHCHIGEIKEYDQDDNLLNYYKK